MKLQQLRCLKAVVESGLNVTEAAERLFTSQPGVSRQIRMLEDELGVLIFQRSGKHLTHVTPEGRQILARAERILAEVDGIRSLAADFSDERRGLLRLATTHTQARYFLPPRIDAFRHDYPEVRLQIEQGGPADIARMAASGEVDFGIATEGVAQNRERVMLPAYRWHHCLVVPRDHPLARTPPADLAAVAAHPLVTYVHGFTGRGQLERDFRAADLEPDVVLSAADSDVIKAYVRLGLGVGLIARMAYEPDEDADLVSIDARHLFTEQVTRVGFNRGMFMRGYMYDFLALLASHLTLERVDRALHAADQKGVDAVFADVALPRY